MSYDKPPEYFFDRSLGKATATRLRDRGWIIHLIAEFYEDDAADIADEEWIAEGCSRGWILLTKDKKIRYRSHELGALGKWVPLLPAIRKPGPRRDGSALCRR